MKKIIIYSICVSLCLLPFSIQASKWYVAPASYTTGTNNGTSASNAWRGIAFIVWSNINPGDSLLLRSDLGSYRTFLIPAVSGISGNRISIAGFPGMAHLDSSLILLSNVSHLEIKNIEVSNSPFSALTLRNNAHHISISNAIFRNSPQGVSIEKSSGNHILLSNSLISDNQTNGIGIDSSECSPGQENIVRDCRILRNGIHGIELIGNRYIIEGNTVALNGMNSTGTSGIHLFSGFAGGNLGMGRNNVIRYNFCNDNIEIVDSVGFGPDGNGIQLDQYTRDNLVYYNICLDNDGAGISILDSRNNHIWNNSLAYNNQDSAGGHPLLAQLRFLADIAVISLLAQSDSLHHSQNNDFRNNLVYVNAADTLIAVGIDGPSTQAGGNTFSNNLFWNQDSSGSVWQWDQSRGTDSSGWNNLSGGNDFMINPLWTIGNPEYASDFRYFDPWALYQKGISVGLNRDYAADSVMDPPTIGAYELLSTSLKNTWSSEEWIKIFPNPTKGHLNIEFADRQMATEISIFDLKGKRLHFFQNQSRIELNDLPPGTYLLMVETNSKIFSRKIIKLK